MSEKASLPSFAVLIGVLFGLLLLYSGSILLGILMMLIAAGSSVLLLGNGSEAPVDGPSPDRTMATDEALAALRTRYARGELSQEQFERKLERLLTTETVEDAETFVAEQTAPGAEPSDSERPPGSAPGEHGDRTRESKNRNTE